MKTAEKKNMTPEETGKDSPALRYLQWSCDKRYQGGIRTVIQRGKGTDKDYVQRRFVYLCVFAPASVHAAIRHPVCEIVA